MNFDMFNAPQRQKLLIAAVITLAVLWLLNSYIYQPKIKELNRCKNTLKKLEAEFQSILGEDIILKEGDEAQIKALEEELNKLSEKIPTEKEIPYLIGKFITDIGSGLQIDYNLIEPQNIVDEQDYRRLPLKVEFLSNLQDFYSYLSQLKNLPSTIRIDSLSISSTENNKILIVMQLSAFVIAGKPAKTREAAALSPSYYKDLFNAPTSLTSATTGISKTTPATVAQTGTGLTLQGIWMGKKPKAFINDNVAAVGDTVNGYVVVAIYQDRAVLTKKGKRYTLKLEE